MSVSLTDRRWVLSPGLQEAPIMDRLCTHFVLTLTMRYAAHFNVKRDWSGLLALTAGHLVWPTPMLERVRAFLGRRITTHEQWAGHESLSHEAFLEKFGVWRGAYEEGSLFYYFDEFIKDTPKDFLLLLNTTKAWLEDRNKQERPLVEKNIQSLGDLLQLNPAEQALLLYGTLTRYQRDLRSFLIDCKVTHAQEAYAAIAEVAGVDAKDVAEAVRSGSRLERTGMLDNLIAEHSITDLSDLMKVSDHLPTVLMQEYKDDAELMAVFTRPSKPSTLQLDDFAFVQEDAQVLVSLLKNATTDKAQGVNVLMYGPPGTGKTELAKVVAQAAGIELYEVEYADREGNSLSGRDRYRSLQISQVFLKGSPAVALLFDEVEDVFPPISSDTAQLMARMDSAGDTGGHGSVSGKAWVNQVLETNPVPVIWVTNRIDQIDPAFRRRFQYHLELTSPPPGARERLISRALEGVATTPEFVNRLANRQGLTPAQIRTAVRFAELVTPRDASDAAATMSLIERQLSNADKALGNVSTNKPARPAVTTYDLSLINVESRFEIPRVVEALRRRGVGSLCFHGAPGTGKTALAEHIAHEMGRPLMIRQASDLVSKYVGETEQNMAKMFDEAHHEKAVLLLDEADTFLRSRQMAERNYEVSEVNEMLQGMERFGGVFICTTNLFNDLDEAALRRFTFKIKFLPLTPEQRTRMFLTEALGAPDAVMSAEQAERLGHLDLLAPGDFAAVKRQIDILGEPLTADEFLSQLEAEHRVKPGVRERRKIGF